jgi:uncharacterized iron-regulated membrane protein
LTAVYLDQFSGALLHAPISAAPSAGDRIMGWIAPLHVGSFGGAPVKIAWLVFGLAPPALFVTGFIMWWTRVVRPRRTGVRAPGSGPRAESGPGAM